MQDNMNECLHTHALIHKVKVFMFIIIFWKAFVLNNTQKDPFHMFVCAWCCKAANGIVYERKALCFNTILVWRMLSKSQHLCITRWAIIYTRTTYMSLQRWSKGEQIRRIRFRPECVIIAKLLFAKFFLPASQV